MFCNLLWPLLSFLTIAKIPSIEPLVEKAFHGTFFHVRSTYSNDEADPLLSVKIEQDGLPGTQNKVVRYTFTPGLRDLTYHDLEGNEIEEIINDDYSIGFKWSVKDIGILRLFWDGSVHLVGEEKSAKPSLAFDLLGKFSVQDAALSAIKVSAYETQFVGDNTIDHVRILGGDTLKDNPVFISEEDHLKTKTIVSDRNIVNNGTLSFQDGGRLHVKDKFLMNYGVIEGEGALVMDQMSEFLNMNTVNVPSLRLHAGEINNKGDITTKESLMTTIDDLLNEGNITATHRLTFKGKNIANDGVFRIKHGDIDCTEQFLNTKEFQIVDGKISAMHHLNLGTHLWGGTLDQSIPVFEGVVNDTSRTYKHGGGLENRGLYIHVDQENLLKITGPSIDNTGDFVVPSLDVHVDRWTNKKRVDIAHQMTGRIGYLDDRGDMRVKRDLTTRNGTVPSRSTSTPSPEVKEVNVTLNRPGHIFDGSEFTNLTVSGVLEVYGYGLDLSGYHSFPNIHKISFHLEDDAWISGALNVRGGIAITAKDFTLNSGKISSKGPIVMRVNNGLFRDGTIISDTKIDIKGEEDLTFFNSRVVGRFSVKARAQGEFWAETQAYKRTHYSEDKEAESQTTITQEFSKPKTTLTSKEGDVEIEGDKGLDSTAITIEGGVDAHIRSRDGGVKLEGRLLKRRAERVGKKEDEINQTVIPDPLKVDAKRDAAIASQEDDETYAANAEIRADRAINWLGGTVKLDTQVGYNVREIITYE